MTSLQLFVIKLLLDTSKNDIILAFHLLGEKDDSPKKVNKPKAAKSSLQALIKIQELKKQLMHRGKETTEEPKSPFCFKAISQKHELSLERKPPSPLKVPGHTHNTQQLCFLNIRMLAHIMLIHQLSPVSVTFTVKHQALFCIN